MEINNLTNFTGPGGVTKPIKVRCPQCLKLYSVDPKEIKEPRPRFECASCQSRFWLAYPESLNQGELIGFPLDWIEKPKIEEIIASKPEIVPTPSAIDAKGQVTGPSPAVEKRKICPKCHYSNHLNTTECISCRIVYSKYEALVFEDPKVVATHELRGLWQKIIEAYENEKLHQDFLRASQRAANFEYAAHKYHTLLHAYPQDEIAKRFIDAINALSGLKMDRPKATKKFAGGLRPRIPFLSIIIFLSAALMVFGYSVPGARNLVGFGAAIMFFSLAIRYYFLGRRE